MATHSHLGTVCNQCGRIFYGKKATGRPRVFCSAACRQKHYRRAKEDERGRKLTEEARRLLGEPTFVTRPG